MHAVERGAACQEKLAAEAAERAEQEAQELKEYRSQLTFKVSTFLGKHIRLDMTPAFQDGLCSRYRFWQTDRRSMRACRKMDTGVIQILRSI